MDTITTTDLQSCATRVAATVDRPVDAVTVSYQHYTPGVGEDNTPPGWYWTVTVSVKRARSTKGYSTDITGTSDDATLEGLKQAADDVIKNIRSGRELGTLV